MCLAIPAQIIAIEQDIAIVSFGKTLRRAKNLANAKPGEYAIVRGGIVLEVLPEEQAKKTQKEFERISAKLKKKKKLFAV